MCRPFSTLAQWLRQGRRGIVFLVLFGGLAAAAFSAVSVQDDAGNPLMLPQAAQRVVTLAPHTMELVCAAGACDRIVGKGSHSFYPPVARDLPEVGDNRQMDVERIIALKPDLLVLWRYGVSQRQVAQLKQFGIPVFVSNPRRIDDIADSLERLGRLLNTTSVAQKKADALRARLAAIRKRYAGRSSVRVFYQISDRPLYTLNGQHMISEAIQVCGGINVFSEMKTMAPQISVEAVLQADPDVILNTSVDTQSPGLIFWQRYPALKAVRHRHLYALNPDWLDRPGPRFIDGVKTLCEAMEKAR